MDARFRNQTDSGPNVLLDGILSSAKSSALNEKQLLSDALTQLTIGMLVTNSGKITSDLVSLLLLTNIYL